ncbi:hypothetical protein M514_05959 [Trichuris suis]|uniref:Uncharacterized protein n=1 Tax=Trichuris suis TaxID=68888 RepID=A0A085N7U3_9BILA|nr:hypothetical protein M514_05959 [Trichuris suis]
MTRSTFNKGVIAKLEERSSEKNNSGAAFESSCNGMTTPYLGTNGSRLDGSARREGASRKRDWANERQTMYGSRHGQRFEREQFHSDRPGFKPDLEEDVPHRPNENNNVHAWAEDCPPDRSWVPWDEDDEDKRIPEEPSAVRVERWLQKHFREDTFESTKSGVSNEAPGSTDNDATRNSSARRELSRTRSAKERNVTRDVTATDSKTVPHSANERSFRDSRDARLKPPPVEKDRSSSNPNAARQGGQPIRRDFGITSASGDEPGDGSTLAGIVSNAMLNKRTLFGIGIFCLDAFVFSLLDSVSPCPGMNHQAKGSPSTRFPDKSFQGNIADVKQPLKTSDKKVETTVNRSKSEKSYDADDIFAWSYCDNCSDMMSSSDSYDLLCEACILNMSVKNLRLVKIPPKPETADRAIQVNVTCVDAEVGTVQDQ